MRARHWSASAWTLVLAAGVLGIGGDLLLRGGMWRVGFALWITTIVASVFVLDWQAPTERRLMLAGIALAAFGLAWRDSPMLYVIDMLSVICMGMLTIWHGMGYRLGDLTWIEAVRAAVLAAINSVAGATGVIGDAIDSQDGSTRQHAGMRGAMIGIVLAIPPLIVVGALLASSDVVFDGILERVMTTVLADGMSHLLIAVLLAWLVAGWLRAATGNPLGRSLPEVNSPGLPFVSVAVGLYALLALLAGFLATQARVLFGGAAFLRETAGLSVANYAREGFFQLILAAGVVLVTLVVAEWLLRVDDAAGRRHYRLVGTALLSLVATLLVSSAVRIWLYMREFGLSVDRAFASAAILWVSGALIAFAVTTLRGRPSRFMPVAVLVTVAWVTMMNLSNPEALVVQVNVARAEAGQPFDAKYHARLSADALPTMTRLATRLSVADCALVQQELRTWWTERVRDVVSGGGDWRSTDVPLIRARAWTAAGTIGCAAAPAMTSAGNATTAPSTPSSRASRGTRGRRTVTAGTSTRTTAVSRR